MNTSPLPQPQLAVSVLWSNRDGKNISWFHPRCCPLPDGKVVMTLQSIGGSDFYGSVCESTSVDGCQTWSAPLPVPDMGWQNLACGMTEGICDTVPEFHPPTQTVLAIGTNVYYQQGRLCDTLSHWGTYRGPKLQRFPYWAIRDTCGNWLKTRQRLMVPPLQDTSCLSCGASQRVFQKQDTLLIPFTFSVFNRRDARVCSARFAYDGQNLVFLDLGNALEHPVERGLLEPSMTVFQERFLLTIRAEDGCAYQAESKDGLNWQNLRPWAFDDGTPVRTSSTQQHWLTLDDRLFLVYTRDTGKNAVAVRFRAPLLMAEVNQDLQLIRESEQVVFPMLEEDGKAAEMGNFQAMPLNAKTGIITVGEGRYNHHYHGNVYQALLSLP